MSRWTTNLYPEEVIGVSLTGNGEQGPLSAWILGGTLAAIAYAVLAYGAVTSLRVTAFEVAACVLLMLWCARQVMLGSVSLPPWQVFLPGALFLALSVVQLAGALSAYRYATEQAVLLRACCGVLFLVAYDCVGATRQRATLAAALATFGAVYALFAMLQSLATPGRFLWTTGEHLSGRPFGTYFNSNHYAGLMEMLLPFALVPAFCPAVERRLRAAAAAAAALMAASVALSESRGGLAIIVAQIAVFVLIVWRRRRRAAAVPLIAIIGAVLILLVAAGQRSWISRFSEVQESIRVAILRDSVAMVRAHPLLGFGSGTFATVYPSYRSSHANVLVNAAHNDYLQVLIENGVIGLGLVVWFLAVVFRAGAKRARRWPREIDGAVWMSALLGIGGIAVHSFFDFNLQIPANLGLFAVLCATAVTGPQFRMRN